MLPITTYPKYLLHNHEKWGNRVALRHKDYGIWQEYTWQHCYQTVKYFSLGLLSLGLVPAERVIVIGDAKPKGFLAVVAIQATRGVVVGLHGESLPPELEHVVEHCESKLAVVEGQAQVDNILGSKNLSASLQKVIYWDPKGMRGYTDPKLTSFEEVTALGRKYEQTHPGAFEEGVAAGSENELAIIAYTPGTTGPPKAAMVSHRSALESSCAWLNAVRLKERDAIFCYAPPGSILEQWAAGLHYISGAILHFAEDPESVAEDYREISPRLLVLFPRQWENLASVLQLSIRESGLFKRLVSNLFIPVGYRMANLPIEGKSPGILWKALKGLGNTLVFRPLRDHLGMVNTNYPSTVGSFLAPELIGLYHALGLRLRQVFGGVEMGLVAGHLLDDVNIDTVGPPYPGAELRISETGEILWRGSTVFTGYYKDAEGTARALKDGWFSSGDTGYINQKGHLVFVDRVSHLGQLRDGHKYAPAYIESKLKFGLYIKDVMVVGGEQRDHLAALLNIDFDVAGRWAEEQGISFTTTADLSQKEEIAELVARDIQKVNKDLPEPLRIRRFVILLREFDPHEGEVTRSRKLRRKLVEQRYAEVIEGIYSGKTEVPLVGQVKYRDGRTVPVSTTLKIRPVEE